VGPTYQWQKRNKRKVERGRRWVLRAQSVGLAWVVLSRVGPVGCCPLFFCDIFLFCFLSFAFWLRTGSNNFVNFSKIQSIKVVQPGTSFQIKNRFSIKPYEF
jgi:hypothetical protein